VSWQKVGIGRVIAYPSIRCNDATFCQSAHRATAIHPWPKSGSTPDLKNALASSAELGKMLFCRFFIYSKSVDLTHAEAFHGQQTARQWTTQGGTQETPHASEDSASQVA
jgi:hypothetical protein